MYRALGLLLTLTVVMTAAVWLSPSSAEAQKLDAQIYELDTWAIPRGIAHLDEALAFVRFATGSEIARLRGHGKGVLCAVFTPDGERIAAGGRDGTVRLWSTETFDQVGTLVGHESYVYSLAWSEDGERLYSGSGDGTIRIWDRETGQQRASLRGHQRGVESLTFSPDSPW